MQSGRVAWIASSRNWVYCEPDHFQQKNALETTFIVNAPRQFHPRIEDRDREPSTPDERMDLIIITHFQKAV
jgi:hypothetical protein